MKQRFWLHVIPSGMALLWLLLLLLNARSSTFSMKEISIQEIQVAFKAGTLTSHKLVQFYIDRIADLDRTLQSVIEINPDALTLADEADRRRAEEGIGGGLHGIPILIKDNIATADKLNTTAGSFALLGSVVSRDAGIVAKLRKAGAIIFGKANLSEWANLRSSNSTSGWSARGGQTKNPYNLNEDPCGSSSGSAVAVAANLISVSIGTETDGSILCPSSFNGVVGIKPTVGLTSRSGVIPVSHNQDSVGPICRTVADAVEVLDAIVGFDEFDSDATGPAAHLIPSGGYKQFLNDDGLHGKQLGILRHPCFDGIDAAEESKLNNLISIIRKRGSIINENLTLPYADEVVASSNSSEEIVMMFDFKQDLNSYLTNLPVSPVRSLSDVISYNNQHYDQELGIFGQDLFLKSESTRGFESEIYKGALQRMKFITEKGIDHLLETYKLDAVIAPSSSSISSVAGIAGYPAISIPAGYSSSTGVPFGICFIAGKGSEPILIEIAYAFEQITKLRKPPPSPFA